MLNMVIFFSINGITLLYLLYNLKLFFKYKENKYFLSLIIICIIPLIIFILILLNEPQFLTAYSLIFLVVNLILRYKLK